MMYKGFLPYAMLAEHVLFLVEIEMLAYFFIFPLRFVIWAISSDLSINL
jgi:hypothetical protein